MRRTLLLSLALLTSCGTPPIETHPYYAIDGDTIATGDGQRIRLLYIDAPEMPDHCRPGRHCVPGDPFEAQRFLQSLLSKGDMRCEDQGRDVYERRLADCWIEAHPRDINLSQAMLDSGLVGLYERTR